MGQTGSFGTANLKQRQSFTRPTFVGPKRNLCGCSCLDLEDEAGQEVHGVVAASIAAGSIVVGSQAVETLVGSQAVETRVASVLDGQVEVLDRPHRKIQCVSPAFRAAVGASRDPSGGK